MDRDTKNTMLPSLAKLKKPSSKDTGLVSILQDPSDRWCTRYELFTRTLHFCTKLHISNNPNCGRWHVNLGGDHVFTCPHCGISLNRDDNGARGNLLAAYGKAVGVLADATSNQ